MRLDDWKRPELIVDAARGLPDAVVVILGEGSEEERLRSLADGVDLRLPGFRLDAVSLLPAFDVFVHPSPTDNQPLAIFEAMAAGVPVVVADQGGAALMVDDGRTGLRAPATPAGMSGAVSRLLDDPVLAGRLAAAGREEVLSRFTTQAMTRQLEALYERLLATDGRASERPPEGKRARVDRRRVLTLDPVLRAPGGDDAARRDGIRVRTRRPVRGPARPAPR